METRLATGWIRRTSSRAFVALAFVLTGCSPTEAGETPGRTAQALLGDGVVISQVFGGGGNSGAAWNQDFVELFNASGAPASLGGLSIQYAGQSAAFASSSDITVLPNVTVPAGGYFLVAMGAAGSAGSSLPMPDATGSSTLAATIGKVALARVTTSLGCGATGDRCPPTNLVDVVGYGTASDFETAPVGALGNTTAALRNAAGCADANDNSVDFSRVAPTPRSSATAVHLCALDAGTADAGDAAATDLGIASDIVDSGADATVDAADSTEEPGEPIDAAIDAAIDENDAAVDASDGATDAEAVDVLDVPADAGPPGVGLVISQVYGGGGNSGAPFNQDFVELFNLSDAPVSLRGLSIQYGSAATGFGSAASTGITLLPDVTLASRRYYLVAMSAAGSAGTALPSPDFMGPSPLASADGKVALARTTTALGCGATDNRCPPTNVIDMVGYGSASDFEGSAAAPGLSNTRGALRRGGGCDDSDDNRTDFTAATPTPRNTGTAAATCTAVLDAGRDVATTDTPAVTDAGGVDGAVRGDASIVDAATVDGPTSDLAADDDSPASADALTVDRVAVDTSAGDVGAGPLDAGTVGDVGTPSDGSAPADCSCRAAGTHAGRGPAIQAALAAAGVLLRRRRRRGVR